MLFEHVQDNEATSPKVNRRRFMQLSGATGLVLGMQLPLAKAFAKAAASDTFMPNAFVRISPDNWVTVIIKHHEMGQGVATGLATIVADELDADWSRVRVEYAPADNKLYANLFFRAQGTGGSTSIANSWDQLRHAGATARAMLVQAAAAQWRVPASSITVTNGVIQSGKHRANLGDMAQAAAALPIPNEVPLKSAEKFTLIGKTTLTRVDALAKSNGTAQYTIDVKLPGLLTAVIARPPTVGATLKSFDATSAKAVPGVTDVVQVPEGVAVVATGMWEAMQGRKALKLEWTTPAQSLSTQALFKEYRALAQTPGAPTEHSVDASKPLAMAASTLDAVYEFPYLAHAPMEPLNCVAWLHDGVLETWAGHQFPAVDHPLAAQAAGLPLDKVTLHTLVSGGSFGRRANPTSDAIVEAVHVAKAINGRAPVRVQRTREDDMHAEYYRPLVVHHAKVGFDKQGAMVGWQHRIVTQSIMAGTAYAAGIKDGIDETSVEGIAPLMYDLPNVRIELHSPVKPVKVLWWRAVGNTHTAYVAETLIDEMAEKAGQDPLAFRLERLSKQPRMAATLKLAAEKAGWGSAVPKGTARGMAAHESFSTYVAQVVEIEKTAAGLPKVKRVVVAVDCGVAVNPDQIIAQMQGSVGFALTAALYGDVPIQDGKIQKANFDTYQVLRMPEMPVVEVHIVPSDAPPSGVGEPAVPPLAPAVANAFYKLTGKRQRRLPFAVV